MWPGHSLKLLFSDWVHPYTNELYEHPSCPDFSGVTMNANLTSNQVRKSHMSLVL